MIAPRILAKHQAVVRTELILTSVNVPLDTLEVTVKLLVGFIFDDKLLK